MTKHTLEFVKPNVGNIPTGVLTTTARKGDKWMKAQPGDVLQMFEAHGGPMFGLAVVAGAPELVPYRDVLAHANRNYAGWTVKEQLEAAYGDIDPEEPFTILPFVRMNATPADLVLADMGRRVEYQALKWGNEADDTKNTPNDWLSFITGWISTWVPHCGFRPYDSKRVDNFREGMIHAGALAVSAATSVDRQRAANGRCFYEAK